MTQILQKRAPALSIRAGALARQLIEKQGLQAYPARRGRRASSFKCRMISRPIIKRCMRAMRWTG